MEKILLIEPNYHCKYPPLGLMKIAYYHKELRGDFAWFAKGTLPDTIPPSVISKLNESKYYKKIISAKSNFVDMVNKTIQNNEWDRIYISTLFTYEWEETIKTIEYAKTLINDKNKIFVGGILATLMSEKLEKATGIKPNIGQLTSSSMIGYEDNINIDRVTPDYSILDNIEYTYAQSNAYYAYTTRGCGMNCEFCAVKILEPNYESYISIKEQINEINNKYGEKKDLLLMDNNVLKSSNFSKIVDDIIELGFGKGATYQNPKTKKSNNRYVDFNQGLDAFLFSDKKAELIGKLAIRPTRIAYDHIEDTDTYVNALNLAAKYDITYLSNYILYNGDDFSGKGHSYKADTPEDLYSRLSLNMEFASRINSRRSKENKELIKIFSFPMRYIPLDDKKRGYVGANWNEKYLRAVQAILIPTQGKGVAGESFFHAAFGQNVQEFMKIIIMPEQYIVTRGEPDKVKETDLTKKLIKHNEFKLWEELRFEWEKLLDLLDEVKRENFIELIKENKFNYDVLICIENELLVKLYIHYFGGASILSVLDRAQIDMDFEVHKNICNYLITDGRPIIKRIARHLVYNDINNNIISSYRKHFGNNGLQCLIEVWTEDMFFSDRAVEIIDGYNGKLRGFHLYLYKWCLKLDLLDIQEQNIIANALDNQDYQIIDNLLTPKHKEIKTNLKRYFISNGVEDVSKNIDAVLDTLSAQMSFDF